MKKPAAAPSTTEAPRGGSDGRWHGRTPWLPGPAHSAQEGPEGEKGETPKKAEAESLTYDGSSPISKEIQAGRESSGQCKNHQGEKPATADLLHYPTTQTE